VTYSVRVGLRSDDEREEIEIYLKNTVTFRSRDGAVVLYRDRWVSPYACICTRMWRVVHLASSDTSIYIYDWRVLEWVDV
jgi:hypothetical protein